MIHRVPKKTARKTRSPARPDDETALFRSLDRVEDFVALLELRAWRARQRASALRTGTRACARANRRVEETQADLEAALRLQHEIHAAVSIARAQMAIIEAEAAESIRRAFRQLRSARDSRRAAAPVQARPRRPRPERPSPERSMEKLGAMAAEAREAVVPVFADRVRLLQSLTELRLKIEELRPLVDAEPEPPAQQQPPSHTLAWIESQAAYLYQQLLIQTGTARALAADLRRLFEKLPEPAREAAARRRPNREKHRTSN